MDENKEQRNDLSQKVESLQTYSSDMADAVRENEISVIRIALAEKEKKEMEEAYKKAEGTGLQKTLFIVGGIILIGVGIAAGYILYKRYEARTAALQQAAAPAPIVTLISYDTQTLLDAGTVTSTTAISSLLKTPLSVTGKPQSIQALFLTKTTGVPSAQMPLSDLLTVFNWSIPDALTRSLSGQYMIGGYQDADLTQKPDLFLVFETKDYNQAYASMLQWEPTILGDIAPLFNIDVSGDQSKLLAQPWKDILINNNDARVLYDTDGKALLYYIFVNKNDIIITDSQDAIKEVVIRLQAKNTKAL